MYHDEPFDCAVAGSRLRNNDVFSFLRSLDGQLDING